LMTSTSLALDQAIVLKFGDNSVRIESDKSHHKKSSNSRQETEQKHHNGVEWGRCASGQCMDTHYDKMALPIPDQPNIVNISFEIRDVINVDDEKFTITFSMYFGVRWKEPRLINVDNNTVPNWLPIDLDFSKHIWLPNIFIYDLKDFKVIKVLNELAALYVVAEGEIFLQQATHVSFLCAMRYESYPLDEHTCRFRVGSSSYNDKQMVFNTAKLDYDVSTQNTILDYKVQVSDLSGGDSRLVYGDMGNYSIAGFQIHLKRHMDKYIWNYHFPSGMFVMVSFVSFLINPDVVPGRMGLLVMMFLVLINMFNSVSARSPTVEGMTSVIFWMISCILFVFGALCEYAGILYLKRKNEGGSKQRHSNGLDHRTVIMNKDKCDQWLSSLGDKLPKSQDDIKRIDKIALYSFFVGFLLFNMAYWTNVLSKPTEETN